MSYFKSFRNFVPFSRVGVKPALSDPLLMLHKIAILLQILFYPCLLPIQTFTEKDMCVSKDTGIKQTRGFFAKEEVVVP